MNSNVISTLQRNINIEWGGKGEPTDIAQKIAYRSAIFGQDCLNLRYFIFCSIEVLDKFVS